MKRISSKRIIGIITVCLAMTVAMAPIRAFASEADVNSVTAENALPTATESTDGANTLPSTAESSDNNKQGAENAGGDSSDTSDGDGNSGSFFGDLYAAIEENLGEILSALSFIGSLIIMICYRKGFLPIVSEGVKALASGVGKIDERTGSLTAEAQNMIASVSERLGKSEEALGKIASTLDALQTKLDTESGKSSREEEFITVLSAEVDMLYEIFMAAALPQYLKDSVGERIARMKSTITKVGESNEEN